MVKIFYRLLPIYFSFIILLGFSYIVYNQYAKLADNKRVIGEITKKYRTLTVDYTDYKQKTKNLRQVLIFANDNKSKGVRVGDIIGSYSKKIDGDLSIYYKNFTNGESVVVDGDKKYYMASLYKVILAIYILDEARKVKIDLSDKVGDPGIPIEEALSKIISESNNAYAQALADKYGWKNIETSMKEKLGIDFKFDATLESNVKNIGILFEEIALSLKLEDNESNLLLSFLKSQRNTSKLPKYLPNTVYSHNKTGELDDYSHDAGIFYTPKANYVLVFMSRTPNVSGTNEQMAFMSKEIYETLNDINQSTGSSTLSN